MTIDDKLDKLLEDVTLVKTVIAHHTTELSDLKTQLKPVFFHVTGMQFMIKVLAGIVGAGSLIVGAIALWK
jgi:hypothetical protein